jgi:hypothetical protein
MSRSSTTPPARPRRRITRTELALAAALYAGASQAAHPLITEDAATLGAGTVQAELSAEHAGDTQFGALAGAGVADSVDLIAGHPRHDGDVSLDLKWRFHRRAGTSLALKPGLTVPAAAGTGRPTYGAFLLASRDGEPWSTHWHAGYKANHNVYGEPADLVHLSAAAVYQASGRMKLAGDLGVDTGFDLSTTSRPAWLVAGAIYSVRPALDLDLGCRHGLNRASEADALLVGLTLRW